MLFPSPQQPTFICSAVNSLAVKLKDWLWCLSSFYLLPWFIFISTMKGRTERHPVPLFCLRQADPATDSKDISSCVSHPIVSQRHCNITVLREMIAVEFYGLLQWERWIQWPQSNDIYLPHTTGFNSTEMWLHRENCLFLSYYRARNYTILFSIIISFSLKGPFCKLSSLSPSV